MTKFYATLCLENLEEVAQLILEELEGKTYTFVAANEFFKYKPDVRTNQRLKDEPFSLYFDDNNDPPQFGGFHFSDSYGVWGLSTSQQEPDYDPSFDNPHVAIEWDGTITMTHRAPAGNKIYWVISPQREG